MVQCDGSSGGVISEDEADVDALSQNHGVRQKDCRSEVRGGRGYVVGRPGLVSQQRRDRHGEETDGGGSPGMMPAREKRTRVRCERRDER